MEDEKVIRHQMEDTRTSLTEKLETLEEKVLAPVQEATAAVSETVISVKESVQEGVKNVKDFMDVPQQFDRHPWVMLGGSVACGFLVGALLRQKRQPGPGPPVPRPSSAEPVSSNGRHKPEEPGTPSSPGLLSLLEPELKKLKSLALGVTLGTIREMIKAEVPPHMGQELKEIIDGITKKIGGEPIPSSDWENFGKESPVAKPQEASAPCANGESWGR